MCLISKKLLPLYAGQKLNKRFEIEYDNSHNYLIINKLQTLLQICPILCFFLTPHACDISKLFPAGCVQRNL